MIKPPPAPPPPLRTTLTPLSGFDLRRRCRSPAVGSAFARRRRGGRRATAPADGSIRATANGSPPRRQSIVRSSAAAPTPAPAARRRRRRAALSRRGRARGGLSEGFVDRIAHAWGSLRSARPDRPRTAPNHLAGGGALSVAGGPRSRGNSSPFQTGAADGRKCPRGAGKTCIWAAAPGYSRRHANRRARTGPAAAALQPK